MATAFLEADDYDEAVEACHRNGWTDGLPVIPPTRAKLDRFLEAVGLPGDHEVAYYALRNRPLTAGKLALNAIMAGCLPEYFPVVLALAEAIMDPGVQVHTANASTGSLSLGFIVNGPIREQLKMNCHGNVLGPGNRANSSIGRALRLIQVNVMGSVPGAGGEWEHGRDVLDRACLGNPLRYSSFHIVENEEVYPQLTPFHVTQGFAAEDSVATAFAMGAHLMLTNHFEKTPDEWLNSVAHYLVGAGRLYEGGFGILLMAPEAAKMFVKQGWTKADISRELYRRTQRTIAWVKREGWKIGGRFERGGAVLPGDEDKLVSCAGSPEELHIVICGGPAGNFTAYVQHYGANFQMASRNIRPLAGGVDRGAVDLNAVRAAIEPLRAQLRVDGYDIVLDRGEAGRLGFALSAGAQACAECLVPAAIMELHVREALAGLPQWRGAKVELDYPVQS
ncbi:MAG: hypothetical protein ABW184_11730 [Sphingobium sp.]